MSVCSLSNKSLPKSKDCCCNFLTSGFALAASVFTGLAALSSVSFAFSGSGLVVLSTSTVPFTSMAVCSLLDMLSALEERSATSVSTSNSDVESVMFSPTVAITSDTLPSSVEGRSYFLRPTLTIKSVAVSYTHLTLPTKA